MQKYSNTKEVDEFFRNYYTEIIRGGKSISFLKDFNLKKEDIRNIYTWDNAYEVIKNKEKEKGKMQVFENGYWQFSNKGIEWISNELEKTTLPIPENIIYDPEEKTTTVSWNDGT